MSVMDCEMAFHDRAGDPEVRSQTEDRNPVIPSQMADVVDAIQFSEASHRRTGWRCPRR